MVTGKTKYRTHSAARRLVNHKRLMLNTLRKNEFPDNLLVCEVGYGIDIVVAMMAKDWKEIRCYDRCGGFKEGLLNFFTKRYGLNIKFERSISTMFRFDEIKNDTVVISNTTHIYIDEESERIRKNEKLIYLRDGSILKQSDMPKTLEECRKIFGRGYL